MFMRSGMMKQVVMVISFFTGTDFGLNFDTPTNLSNNPGFSGFPKITVGEGKSVYIVWTDNTPGNLDIFVASVLMEV